MKFIHRIIAMR